MITGCYTFYELSWNGRLAEDIKLGLYYNGFCKFVLNLLWRGLGPAKLRVFPHAYDILDLDNLDKLFVSWLIMYNVQS